MCRQSQLEVFKPRFLAIVVAVGFALADGSLASAEPTIAGGSGRIIELEGTFGALAPKQEDQFGYSVAVSGDWVVVGAPGDDSACPGQNPCGSSGAAYVYHRVGQAWEFSQKLRASDPINSAFFGSAVAIEADTIVMGAPAATGYGGISPTGAVYVFVYDGSTWQERAKLVAQAQSRFGASVAISGNLVVAGAPTNSWGQAFAFRRVLGTWVLEATFVPWDGYGEYFGNAVAVSEETVAVTSTYADAPGTLDSGAAYVFRRVAGTWTREAKVLPDLPIYGSQFGSSVSLVGDRLAVGALGEKALCQPFVCYPGAAYIFARNRSLWSQEARLETRGMYPEYGQTQFGASVAIADEYALVGAAHDNESTCPGSGCNTGAAYAFQQTGETWIELDRFTSPEPVADAAFGFAVAATNTTFVIGAYQDEFGGVTRAGAAYVYRVFVDCNGNGTPDELEPDCNANETPDDCDVRDGTSPDCNENDHPDECDLADGTSTDCNGNEIPDECDTLYAVFASTTLYPIGAGVPQVFSIPEPPLAGSPVRMSFQARGDLGSPSEGIEVQLNGSPMGTVFGESGHDCPAVSDSEELILPKADYNHAVAGGVAEIRMVGTAAVDPNPPGCQSSVMVTVEYQAITDGDCNGNGNPDSCDIADQISPDCNENGVPDECEFVVLGDMNADQEIDTADVLELLACLTGPCAGDECPASLEEACCLRADLDGDADVDLRDAAAIQNALTP